MSGIKNIDEVEITLGMLKKDKELDISKIAKCDSTKSSVTYTVKPELKIKKFNLICK